MSSSSHGADASDNDDSAGSVHKPAVQPAGDAARKCSPLTAPGAATGAAAGDCRCCRTTIGFEAVLVDFDSLDDFLSEPLLEELASLPLDSDFRGDLGGRLSFGLAGSAVSSVEARTLEGDAHRMEDLAQAPPHSGHAVESRVGDRLHDLEAVVAGGADVGVRGHEAPCRLFRLALSHGEC